MKKIILYFSLTGNTEKVAEKIEEIKHFDIESLKPSTPYSNNYEKAGKRTESEKDNDIHPALASLSINIDDYDLIYLGFSTWWYQPPMLIHTFFESINLKGKKIIPFTTSASSTIQDSLPVLTQLAQQNDVELLRGFTANSEREIKKYFDSEKID